MIRIDKTLLYFLGFAALHQAITLGYEVIEMNRISEMLVGLEHPCRDYLFLIEKPASDFPSEILFLSGVALDFITYKLANSSVESPSLILFGNFSELLSATTNNGDAENPFGQYKNYNDNNVKCSFLISQKTSIPKPNVNGKYI